MTAAQRTGLLRSQLLLGIACAVIGWLSTAVSAETSSSLSIRTRDNRALEGQVDSRTDQHQLWIRQQSEHIVLITPVRWDAIASAALDDAPIEIASLVEMAPRLASAGPVAFLAQHEVIDPPQDVLPSAPQVHPHHPGARMTPATRVTNIEIAARLVNFDRDVEVDGIEVAVVVLDTQGYPVPVRGSLSGNLIVERVNSHTGRARFENVQRWSQPVATADFVEGTAFYRLPFRTVRPEMDLALRSQGLLNVRLGVAGQGNYEATVPVAIRPLNPVRDTLQLRTGSRFYRGELTGESGRSYRDHSGEGAPVWTPYNVIGVGVYP